MGDKEGGKCTRALFQRWFHRGILNLTVVHFCRYFRRGGRGACHQRRIQNMEEEHSLLVRPRHDARTRMAIAHRSVAPGRHSVIKLAPTPCIHSNFDCVLLQTYTYRIL